MEIVIKCDQIDCIYNGSSSEEVIETTPSKRTTMIVPYHICIHYKPIIVTIFGKDISTHARKCHSKSTDNTD